METLVDLHASEVGDKAVQAGVPPWFCDEWPTIRKGMNFVKRFLPSYLKPIVTFLVAAGNAIYAAGCKR